MNLQKLKLPGTELVDQNADYSGTQNIFIDLEGINGKSDNDAFEYLH